MQNKGQNETQVKLVSYLLNKIVVSHISTSSWYIWMYYSLMCDQIDMY